ASVRFWRVCIDSVSLPLTMRGMVLVTPLIAFSTPVCTSWILVLMMGRTASGSAALIATLTRSFTTSSTVFRSPVSIVARVVVGTVRSSSASSTGRHRRGFCVARAFFAQRRESGDVHCMTDLLWNVPGCGLRYEPAEKVRVLLNRDNVV